MFWRNKAEGASCRARPLRVMAGLDPAMTNDRPQQWRMLIQCERDRVLRLPAAAVDHLAGDEARVVGGEKRDRRRLLFRQAAPPQRLLVADVLAHLAAVLGLRRRFVDDVARL